MNTSRKAMEWLICFSIVNLMLGCLLFKKYKKFNESLSLSKAARILFHYCNIFLSLKYSLRHYYLLQINNNAGYDKDY